MRARRQRTASLLLATAMALGSCGGDGDDEAGDATSGTERGAGAAALEETAAYATGEGADGDGGAGSGRASPAAPASTIAGAPAGPAGPPSGQEVAPAMTAGSVDDNERWDDYLRYREAFLATGQRAEELAVEGRRVLTVVDGDGRPVLGAQVTAVARGSEAPLDVARTTADGRALLLLPPATGDPQAQGDDEVPVDVVVAGGDAAVTVALDPGTLAQTVVLDGAARPDAVRLDLHFLIDATGSMGDEIERLKAHMSSVAEQVASLPGDPDVRFAMTAYRDEGDEFVTRTWTFTDDVGAFTDALAGVVADGGGDDPEALNEALAESLSEPGWRGPDTVKLVVLLADAPPQFDRDPPYVESIAHARAAGVKVLPIASSNTSEQAEFVFRQLAQATLGRFTFLTYGADGASPGTGTPMHVDDYEVLALDALVVRLVADELAHRG